jgi:hypothetical protein
MTDIADCSVVARQISQSRFWPLSPCLLLLPTTSPRRTLRHPLPESSQALLSSMRGHLFTQIQPTRLDRRRLFRDQMIPAKTQPVGEVSRGLGIAGSLTGAGREQPSSVGTVSTAAAAVKAERYEPRIFGFRVNEEAKLSRWRTARRDT